MSEPTITKRCTKCKETKLLTDFSKDKYRADGLKCACKVCDCKHSLEYSKTERGIKLRRIRQQTEKVKTYQSNYQKSDVGKINHCTNIKKYRKRFPMRIRARDAVKYATRVGKLPKPKTLQCYLCFEPANEYHHYLGYKPKHKLDVLPICTKCHKIQDSLVCVAADIE